MAFNPNEVDSNEVIDSLVKQIAVHVREKAIMEASLAKALQEVVNQTETNQQLQQKLNEISGEVKAIRDAQKARKDAAAEVVEGTTAD